MCIICIYVCTQTYMYVCVYMYWYIYRGGFAYLIASIWGESQFRKPLDGERPLSFKTGHVVGAPAAEFGYWWREPVAHCASLHRGRWPSRWAEKLQCIKSSVLPGYPTRL